MTAEYLDPKTGETFPLDAPRWCGTDRAPLLLTLLPGIDRRDIDASKPGLWRYGAALPFLPEEPITMGEGRTPLIARTLRFPADVFPGNAPVLLKCDWLMPSGSFKDRGASVMLSLLRAQGIMSVLQDSSGNGGAAVAAYAAAGGMRATILAPATASPGKTVQSRAYGATVELVPGSRQDVTDAAIKRAATMFYASHSWHPFFLHGTKTLAYELWEDLGFRAPDNIVVPCGSGSNVLGCEIGFSELLRVGAIERMPRIFAAQPANCAPVAAHFMADPDETPEVPIRPTIADGTAIAHPIRLREILGALRKTRGGAVTLSEAEIAAATLHLGRIGFYVEPTAAQAAAAFGKLLGSGAVAPEQTTVLVLTASGLKATASIADLLA